jgi:hypothetical protein
MILLSVRKLEFAISTVALRIELFFLRHETKLTHLTQGKLQRRNDRCRESVLSFEGPVVSMTTHGDRLNTVHLVLESIAAGSVLPSRLVLWVDTKDAFETRTPGLERLVERGLEICLSDNYGPHTKYFPYLLSEDTLNKPLVTADDDLLYSPWWLDGLVQSHQSYPEYVNCYRAHVVGINGGALAPYRSWRKCRSNEPSFLYFPTGVSGCIYPISLQERLKSAGTEFMGMCPKADDVWIHLNALRIGMKVRQIREHPLRFPLVPGTQRSGLYHSNVLEDGNDSQISKTYSKDDIAFLQVCLKDAHTQPIP